VYNANATLLPAPAAAALAGGKSYKISGPGHMLEDLAQLKQGNA